MSTHPDTHQHDERAPLDRRAVVAREQERFGGTKPGAAFFGWLSALGLSVILSTFLVATGASIDLVPDDADSSALGSGRARQSPVGDEIREAGLVRSP